MSRVSKNSKETTFTIYDFIRAAVSAPHTAEQMLQENPNWLTARTSAGETALDYLVVENYREAARFLISRGADVNTTEPGNDSPLIFAAQLGYHEMVALLLESGADIETQGIYGFTPLLMAAKNGYSEICDMLLTAGADAHFRDDIYGSILDIALPRKRNQVVAVLEKHGYTEESI